MVYVQYVMYASHGMCALGCATLSRPRVKVIHTVSLGHVCSVVVPVLYILALVHARKQQPQNAHQLTGVVFDLVVELPGKRADSTTNCCADIVHKLFSSARQRMHRPSKPGDWAVENRVHEAVHQITPTW